MYRLHALLRLEQNHFFKSRPHFNELSNPEKPIGTHASLYLLEKRQGCLLEQGILLGLIL